MRTAAVPILLSLPLALAVPVVAALAGPGPTVVEVPRGDPAAWSEVKAAPGRILRLSAEPASRWTLVDDEGADLLVCDGGKFGDFAAPAGGRYKLIVTGPDGAVARVVVVVGNAPPGPNPPKPPDPPAPPADPLKDRITKAFSADPESDGAKKKSQAKDLAELYRQLAAKVVPDAALTGPTELFQRARDTAKLLVGDAALLGVRQVVGEELKAILPIEAPLTDDQRAAAKKLFERLAVILDTIGA